MSISMLNNSIASIARYPIGLRHDSKEQMWGIELNKDKPESVWLPKPEIEDPTSRHTLYLHRCLLGKDAKQKERNVVEAVTKDVSGSEVAAPILSLTLGRNDQSKLGLSFGSPDEDQERLEPVTFRLVAGSGPVHLIGSQMTENYSDVMDDTGDMDDEDEDDVDEEEDEEEEEEEEEEENPAPKKKAKK